MAQSKGMYPQGAILKVLEDTSIPLDGELEELVRDTVGHLAIVLEDSKIYENVRKITEYCCLTSWNGFKTLLRFIWKACKEQMQGRGLLFALSVFITCLGAMTCTIISRGKIPQRTIADWLLSALLWVSRALIGSGVTGMCVLGIAKIREVQLRLGTGNDDDNILVDIEA